MLTIGLDAHHCTSTLHILDGRGSGRSKTIRGKAAKVVAWLRGLDAPFQIAFEASTQYGWLHDQIAALPNARRVVVAHPGKMAAIFKNKRKHDKADARTLATLLLIDQLPQVWVPSIGLRRWRELIEHRRQAVNKRARAKNALRSLLRTYAIDTPKSLWTIKGMAWLRDLSWSSAIEALRCNQLLQEIEHYNTMVAQVELMLNEIAKDHAGVALLMTIPGIGPRTAEAIMAYIGDPHRFSRTRNVGAYFGLVPCQDESAGKAKFGHITKDGPSTARWLIVEAMWQVAQRSPSMATRIERMTRGRKDRRKIAIVGAARHLLCVMLAMLKTGECWREEVIETTTDADTTKADAVATANDATVMA